jgi:hypothetical protein
MLFSKTARANDRAAQTATAEHLRQRRADTELRTAATAYQIAIAASIADPTPSNYARQHDAWVRYTRARKAAGSSA